MSYIPLTSKLDTKKQTESIDALSFEQSIVIEDLGSYLSPVTKAITYGTAVKLAVGASAISNRRSLYIRNDGEGVAIISGTNSATMNGRRLLPNQSMTIKFAVGSDGTLSAVDLYARAETISTELYIEEH